MVPPDPCDPLGDFNSPEGLTLSIVILAILWFGFHALSLLALKLYARRYD